MPRSEEDACKYKARDERSGMAILAMVHGLEARATCYRCRFQAGRAQRRSCRQMRRCSRLRVICPG